MMATDLAAVAEFAKGSLGALDLGFQVSVPSTWSSRMFRGNNAHSKILAIILAYQSPKDFLTGQAIDVNKALAWQNGKEFQHFFPQAFLKTKGVASSRISSLANMVYLSSASNKLISDRAPSDYVAKLLAEHGADARAWLATNLINDAAIDAALADDYDAFLVARSNAINERAKIQAGWDPST
jgi:hypothetical protein